MQDLLSETICKSNNTILINGYEETLSEEDAERYKPPKYKNFDLIDSEYEKGESDEENSNQCY